MKTTICQNSGNYCCFACAGASIPSTPFITFFDNADISELPECCNDENLATCVPVNIDPSRLGGGILLLPKNVRLTLDPKSPDGTYHYIDPRGTSADAIFTCNEKDDSCHGQATDADGESYVLEYCGSQGHVWKQSNADSLYDSHCEPVYGPELDNALDEEEEDIADKENVALFSIKFYYTRAFKNRTPDIDGFIKQAVAKTNLAYLNSGVPLGAFTLCSEEAPSIKDGTDSNAALKAFSKLKGSVEALRGTADTAVLLVHSLSDTSCGIGRMKAFTSKETISVVVKSCAENQFTLAHEIGHNFGLAHDEGNNGENKLPYSYGTGHLIEGKSWNGERYVTVMAYPNPKANITRVNYFSNPNVIFPWTRTPTGTETSNSARVLMNNRFKMADVGDESSDTCAAAKASPLPSLLPTFIKDDDDSYENSDEERFEASSEDQSDSIIH